jgi:hypothetical protein
MSYMNLYRRRIGIWKKTKKNEVDWNRNEKREQDDVDEKINNRMQRKQKYAERDLKENPINHRGYVPIFFATCVPIRTKVSS